MTFLRRLWERLFDTVGFVIFLALGALLATALFLLRIIPDRERAAEARASEDARRKAEELRAKVAAAKVARDAALAAEEARIQAQAAERRRAGAIAAANALIRQRRK